MPTGPLGGYKPNADIGLEGFGGGGFGGGRNVRSRPSPIVPVERRTGSRKGEPGVPIGKGGMKKINRKPLDLPAKGRPRNMNDEMFDHLGKQGVLDLPKGSSLRKDIMNQYPDVFKGHTFRYAKNRTPFV